MLIRLLVLSMILIGFNVTMINAEAQEQNALTYFNHVPEKWRSEAISFPLDFAPSLKYQGKLELLFSPGMFSDKSEEFLSYGFVWAIEGTEIPNTETLEQDLKTYYYGLQSVVSENTLRAKTEGRVWFGKESSNGVLSYEGVIEWTEPFVTQQRQTLNLRVTFHIDEKRNQWIGFFRVSPQQATHPIWKTLEALPLDINNP